MTFREVTQARLILEPLRAATADERAVVTENVKDFAPLHRLEPQASCTWQHCTPPGRTVVESDGEYHMV